VLDTIDFDTVGGICYRPDIKIDFPYEAKYDQHQNLILSGSAWIFDLDSSIIKEYLGTYMLDSDYQVIKSLLLTKSNKTFQSSYAKRMEKF